MMLHRLPILDSAASPNPQTATRTHCPYCAFQCGMLVTVGTAGLKIAADPEFPVNRGQMCIKGFNAADLLSAPDRILSPLRRTPDGRFEEVSWDAALDEIAARIRRLQASHGNHAVGCFGSGALTNEKAYLLGKFARVALRTSNIDYNGRYCMSSAAAGQNRSFGIDRGMPFPVSDLAHTGTCMLWGSNLADTLPPIMQYVEQLKSGGGKLIVVDPRRTETARGADLHLQLTPGSDVALANGLLYIAMEEDLVDRAYIAARTRSWNELSALAQQYHPAYVERLTGVSIDLLRRAARWMADGPSMLLSARGIEQQSKGTDGVGALINLMLALGKVGKPFSGYGTLTGQGNGQGGREHGQKSDQLPGYRSIEDDADRAYMARFWGINEADLPRKGMSAVELIEACGSEVRALLVFGTNVLAATPDADTVRRRLGGLDLLVVADSFLSETAQVADFVLPTLQFAEEDGTLTNFEGRVIRRRKVVDAPHGPRSDIAIVCELAARLGESERFNFESAESVFDELRRATAGGRADYSGISYVKIDANDGVCWPCPDEDHPGTPRLFATRFAHADGRARFVVVPHRAAGEEPDAEYPLYFTTGRYREHYNTGVQTRRVEALSNARPAPRIQIHPRLARRYGITDGSMIRVISRRGAVVFEAAITTDIRPDTLFAPFHWGGRQAANILTNPALDPVSKMPEFKLCAVRIIPMTDGDGSLDHA
jgi:assimilatory nitrate reductase catalytic subunit